MFLCTRHPYSERSSICVSYSHTPSVPERRQRTKTAKNPLLGLVCLFATEYLTRVRHRFAASRHKLRQQFDGHQALR